jgi:hypothetical protein
MNDKTVEVLITKIIWYTILIVVIVGAFGNAIAFVVCSRSNLKNTVFSTYFRFIAVVDTTTLIFNTFLQKFMSAVFKIRLSTSSNDICRLTKIIAYALTVPSGWILVVVSLDRYLSIAFPTRFRIRKNRLFQLLICIILVLKDFVYYGQLYFSFVKYKTNITIYDNTTNQTNQTIEQSWTCQEIEPALLSWLDLANSGILPTLLMFICTFFILKCLHDSKKNIIDHNNQERPKISNRQKKFAITVLSLNIIFLLTNIPVVVWNVFREFQVYIEPNIQNLITSIIFLIYYIQYGSCFFINFTVNSIFKDEVFALFSCQNNGNKHQKNSKYVLSSK